MAQFEELRQYIATFEEFLENRLQPLKDNWSEFLKKRGYSSTEIEMYEKGETDDWKLRLNISLDFTMFDQSREMKNFEEMFPQILRRSFFITVYAIFEKSLDSYCRAYGETSNSPLVLNDLQGKGVIRSRKYLVKVLQRPFPDDSMEWQEIQAYNKLRNCFVHNDGRIQNYPDEKFIRSYIAHNAPLIEIDSWNEIVIKKGFCEKVLNVFEQFEKQLSTIMIRNQ